MELLTSMSDVLKLYVLGYRAISDYHSVWMDTPLDIEFDAYNNNIQISSSVLLTLSKSFQIPGHHTKSKTSITYEPYSKKISLNFLEERFNTDRYIKPQLSFVLMYGLKSQIDIVPKKLYDDMMSLDYSHYTLPEYYYKVRPGELDLANAEMLNNNIDDVSKDLMTRLYSQEYKYWHKEEVFPIFDLVEIIHNSLLELSDSTGILSTSISTDLIDWDKEALYISWSFIPIPEFLLLVYPKPISKSKRNNPQPYTMLPFFDITLILS